MTVWRMSFRVGNQGHEMWPHCFRLGVAAITYPALAETDLSKLPKGEPKELWAQLAPAQKYNLRQVAYEMKAGDVIYVLQGPNIVGKGSVQGPYRFDAEFRLIAPDGVPWAHQIPVNWAADFPETRILLGVEQFAVRELSPDKLEQLQTEVDITIESNERREAFEGETYRTEAAFRRRNRALIQAKKANSDYLCEGCGFSIEETYGSIGREYIIAHHLSPIASGPSTTTLDKIALVCANCHAMVHTQSPPISIEDLRKLL
jgi:hypothetical protein